MNPWEIWMAEFPFGGSMGAKVRPVLLLTGPIGPVPEVLAAYVPTVVPTPFLPSDLVLDPAHPDYRDTNLTTASVVRLHKQATLHQQRFRRPVGRLSPAAMNEVQSRLRTRLSL